ncbi:MAG: hypothetical protein SPJ90_08660 [Prevotella sp.]|nr:hypothetical protein [Prevotellaceae bacterium]MDY5844473.1 hypothetical protein [Prevotella sp.]
MKKIIMLLAFTCTFAVNAMSQEIYNEVNRIMHQAEAIKNDTKRNLEERKIATFKADAIFYLITKAAQNDHFTELELGKQTNAMIDFVNSFVKRLARSSNKQDKEILMARFKNATVQNPLFNDPEKEITYAYVDNEKFITQFSIDTDWVKALNAVK